MAAVAIGLMTTGAAGATPVAVELCLAVDGSGSIAPDEFAFQRQAYAQAITDPRVLQAIAANREGAIAIALMEWGGPDSLHAIVDWTRIAGPDDARAFADAVLAAPRLATGYNSISNAIVFCQAWMAENDFAGTRLVIDVSGDAGQRGGMPLAMARSQALSGGITINALALNYRSGGMTGPAGQPLLEHFQRDVIGGPGAFALAVEQQQDFVEALVRKLVAEVGS